MRIELKRYVDELVQLQSAPGQGNAVRLKNLRELIVEAAAVLEARRLSQPVRNFRCSLALPVKVRRGADALRGTTREIGTDGVCIVLDQPMPRGTLIELWIDVPGWLGPLASAGEVVWSEGGAVGVVFRHDAPNGQPASRDEMIRLVIEKTDCLERLERELEQIEEPPASTLRRKEVMLDLSDPNLAKVSRDLLRAFGFEATLAPQTGMRPSLIVADPVPGVPLALVNGGPIAVVRPPISPAKIFEVIESALGVRAPAFAGT
jgi:hypothetical protein